jgi:predicted metalloprotease with PDZ domain
LFMLLCRRLALSLLSGFALVAPAFALETAFTISMPQPTTHLFDVEMRVTGATGQTADVALPVWTPGSYLVREYARHVQDFEPKGATGETLTWSKTNKNTWRVDTKGQANFTVRYRVYANSLKVQEAELTDGFAFWNNAALLMHVPGQLQTPANITISAPNGWAIATGLPPVNGQANTFRASNFDVLYDSPFLVGPLSQATFTVGGKTHRIAVAGTAPADAASRLVAPVQRIVEAEVAMMHGAGSATGALPYENYTFLYYIRQGTGGGLEHLNSTVIGGGASVFYDRDALNGLLSTTAHEFFHLWNVKRVRPDALGPFNYNEENYTRLLWVAEGLTSYYEDQFMRRAGLTPPREYLQSLAKQITIFEMTPGRNKMSVEEASFDAWIKRYRPDENTINSAIDYYDKGSLIGLVLDLTIRERTNGAKSLDDVMRTLYTEYALKNRNYTPADFQKVSEQVAGGSLEPFFARFVRGRGDIDFDTALKAVGLQVRRTVPNMTPIPHLGGNFVSDPLGAKVASLPSDTPAYEQGLSAGDIVLAVDDLRVTTGDDFYRRVYARSPGDTLRLTVFRADRLVTVPVKLGGRTLLNYQIVPLANPTETQKKLYQGWLGARFGVASTNEQ